MSLVHFHRLLLASGRGNLLCPGPALGRSPAHRCPSSPGGRRPASLLSLCHSGLGEPFLTRRFPSLHKGCCRILGELSRPKMVAALAQKHTGPGMEAGPLCPSPRPRPSFQVPRPRPPPPRPGHPPALFLEQTHSVFLCLFKLVAFWPLFNLDDHDS